MPNCRQAGSESCVSGSYGHGKPSISPSLWRLWHSEKAWTDAPDILWLCRELFCDALCSPAHWLLLALLSSGIGRILTHRLLFHSHSVLRPHLSLQPLKTWGQVENVCRNLSGTAGFPLSAPHRLDRGPRFWRDDVCVWHFWRPASVDGPLDRATLCRSQLS